ncbi:hypothetical protein ACROYT_G019770 [Oculina patagonica]
MGSNSAEGISFEQDRASHKMLADPPPHPNGYQLSKYYWLACNASDVIALVNRLNFTKLTSFNVVLFTTVDDAKRRKDTMIQEGPYLKEVLNTFVVGHWTVSRKISLRHLAVECSDNVVFVKHRASEEPIPLQAFTWLVKHLSREGDAVIDVGVKRK